MSMIHSMENVIRRKKYSAAYIEYRYNTAQNKIKGLGKSSNSYPNQHKLIEKRSFNFE